MSKTWDGFAAVATALSIPARYGTLLAIGVLSLLGVSLVVHTGAWAGMIVVFAGLAVVGVTLGYRRHRRASPLVVAAVGCGLITWVMFGAFSRSLELTGFAALLAAVARDWRLKKQGAHRARP